MSKGNKSKSQFTEQPRRSQAPGVCRLPALASFLSWTTNISEEEAQKTANIVANMNDPARGKLQFDRCESAAERLFLLGGNLVNERGVRITFATQAESELVEQSGVWAVGVLSEDLSEEKYKLSQQVQIGDYRVDFLLPEVSLVVEVDGHDFHERTKEQAAADKQRDRFLARRGLRIIRFTGSEIYADPRAVMAEVLDTAIAIRCVNVEVLYDEFSKGVDQGFEDGQIKGYEEGYEVGYAQRGLALEKPTAMQPMALALPDPSEAAE